MKKILFLLTFLICSPSYAMHQPILGGGTSALATSGTEYNWLSGGEGWFTDQKYFTALTPITGTLTNFQVSLTAPPGVGKSHTFTVLFDGSGSVLTVTISNNETVSVLDTSLLGVSPGSRVVVEHTSSGTPTTAYASWGAEFYSTSGGAIMLGGRGDSSETADPQYAQLAGGGEGWGGTEAKERGVCSVSGTLQKFYMRQSVLSGASKSRVYTVYKNGSPTSITCTVADGVDVTCSDTTHTVSVTAGDTLSLENDRVNTAASTEYSWGIELDPTTDGESPLMGMVAIDAGRDNASTTYNGTSHLGTWGFTENQRNGLATIAFTMKNMYVDFRVAPGAGNNWVTNSRINGGAGTLTCTISEALTTGNDLTHSDSITAGQLLTLQSVPSSAPTVSTSSNSVTAYIPVTSTSRTSDFFEVL